LLLCFRFFAFSMAVCVPSRVINVIQLQFV
jgi:hypothetical protein